MKNDTKVILCFSLAVILCLSSVFLQHLYYLDFGREVRLGEPFTVKLESGEGYWMFASGWMEESTYLYGETFYNFFSSNYNLLQILILLSALFSGLSGILGYTNLPFPSSDVNHEHEESMI